MAGERIEVKIWKNPFTCEDCNFGPRPKCGFQTPCLPADYLPTRQQAIEFMAVAMCQKSNRTNKCENCISAAKGDCDLKSYYPLAEAAMDALIKQGD